MNTRMRPAGTVSPAESLRGVVLEATGRLGRLLRSIRLMLDAMRLAQLAPFAPRDSSAAALVADWRRLSEASSGAKPGAGG